MQNAVFAQVMLPVLFVLALGYWAGYSRCVDNCKPEALTVVLMQFALPCSLFAGVAGASPAVLRSEFPLLAALIAAMLLTYAVSYWIARRCTGATVGEATVQALTVSFANNVAIGLPLLARTYGPAARLAVMAGIVGGALVVSPLTLVLLECAAQDHASATPYRRAGKALNISLRRPVILAPALGLLFPLTGHTLPAVFGSSLELMGAATVGLALFLTGLILSAQPFRLSRGVVAGVALKNFAQPALLLLLLPLFHLHGVLAREAFLLACMPAGFFGTVFGTRYGVASLEASSTLVLSTLLGAATLPLAILLASHLR